MELVDTGSAVQAPDETFANAYEARQAIRAGRWRRHTSGLTPAYVQGNLAILPAELASDFMRFCQSNPKPCPLLAVGQPGNPQLPTLGRDIDVRTDVPAYRVYREGVLVGEVDDLKPCGATTSWPSCWAVRSRSSMGSSTRGFRCAM